MKYDDLISFEPIDSVKVLKEADDIDGARQDVQTLVVSPRLADQLADVIFPNLNLDEPGDAKGILVVANYGTGKTHIMSVVSAIAEHAELADLVSADRVKDAAGSVAGRYEVIRAEIGASEMSLRDIITTELTSGLNKLGVEFKFPDMTKVTNTKDSLEEMMAAFDAVHSNQGLLFVLDELLDYLRTRRDAELIKDLAVLREIGEICRSTRFRFVAGVQEAIFDNPRFAGAADAVSRVRDRFTQMRISREDIAFVVQERLLKKTPEQKAQIREHLQRFTQCYEGMAENLDDFVSLFPVHPAYLRIFEQVSLVEKRKVLTTLSDEIRQLLGNDVPDDNPGLVCYDTYRARLEEDPSNRAIPDVADVLDRTRVLRERVSQALTTKMYVPTALRIIDALAVHRLTTEDVNAPIGPTAGELRDDLTLLPPEVPEMDAFFLETTIRSIVDDIVRAVSGQFITINEQNDQIYLDITKDIDYDQKIDERAESLDEERLDTAYFMALETLLEQREKSYVSGYRIWAYELPWTAKKVARPGYLFMGAPNERSTAQPTRDFYIYFLQPYDPPKFEDGSNPDEVFFRLATPDDDFTKALRRYAGSTALASESTGGHRTVYAEKRQASLREMVGWLTKRMGDAITVTYQGETKPLASWLADSQGPRATVKEQIDTVSASVLTGHFDTRYPGYPAFDVQITGANLGETVKQALHQVINQRPTTLGTKALAGLNLVDPQGHLKVDGEFAAELLGVLANNDGQAVNRDQLLSQRDPGVSTWGPWHLEPAWLVVVAAVLTQQGQLEIGYTGEQLDALNLARLTRMTLDELQAITHVAPPAALPLVLLKDAVELLDLPPGAVRPNGADESLVQQVGTRCHEYSQRILDAKSVLIDGITVWGAQVIEHQMERSAALGAFEAAVNNLKARNTVGKLLRIDFTTEELAAATKGKEALNWVETAVQANLHVTDVASYLREATEVFGPEDPNSIDANDLRTRLLDLFRSDTPPDVGAVAGAKAEGDQLRERFAEAATTAHGRDRLDGAGDQKKRELLESTALADLGQLSTIPLLPGGRFANLQQNLTELHTCKTFDPEDLRRSVFCTECGYRPVAGDATSAYTRLTHLEGEVALMRSEWQGVLAESLNAPEMAEQINLLGQGPKRIVRKFVDTGSLPDPVNEKFVSAVTQVLERFEVRRLGASEVWAILFPETVPATPLELEGRFKELLTDLIDGAETDRVRIVPEEPREESEE
jgi:hypothetical protein